MTRWHESPITRWRLWEWRDRRRVFIAILLWFAIPALITAIVIRQSPHPSASSQRLIGALWWGLAFAATRLFLEALPRSISVSGNQINVFQAGLKNVWFHFTQIRQLKEDGRFVLLEFSNHRRRERVVAPRDLKIGNYERPDDPERATTT